MNNGGNEGVFLAKASISVALTVMLIGAILSLWYYLTNVESQYQRHLENAVTNTTTDRLRGLCDQTKHAMDAGNNVQDFPTVANVAAVLHEYGDMDLLFIFVGERTGFQAGAALKDCYVYTYTASDGSSITAPGGMTIQGGTITPMASTLPVTKAVKHLMQYTSRRCIVTLEDYDMDNDNKRDAVGVAVQVLPPEDI